MNKYQDLVDFILKNVGGKENVLSVTHCMTRLRFTLKDDTLVNQDKMNERSDILKTQFAGGRFQVVVGTDVSDIYHVVQENLGMVMKDDKVEKKSLINALIDIITKVITPVLGILTASGLLQGILALLVATKVLSSSDGAYVVLHAMGQAVFYFLPVVLGYTSAKAFKMNEYVGMMIGATLVIPELMQGIINGKTLYTLFAGTIFQTPVHSTFFGIPILFPENGYQYTVIPIIFIVYISSKIERWLKKVIPNLIAHNVSDFLNLLITVPLALLIIGPITSFLSSIISVTISGLYTISPVITSIIVALLYQPLVIFGLHWPISAIGINNLAQNGVDYIFPMSFTANFAQTAVVLAIFLRTKSKNQKTLAVPAMISGLFCIIEPAIYGFSLPVKKRFAFSMLGGAAGSLILSLFSVKMYAMSFGILGFAAFINPKTGNMNGVVIALIATLVTAIIPFVLTYITFKESEDASNETSNDLVVTEEILSPAVGRMGKLSEVKDIVFSSEALGKGIVIFPEDGEVVAPVDGVISMISPSKHAIGITSDLGVEVLIHVGIDTVEMNGNGFETFVNVGDRVEKGNIILKADLDKIRNNGYSTDIVVVVTNSDNFLDVLPERKDIIKQNERILTVIPFKNSALIKEEE